MYIFEIGQRVERVHSPPGSLVKDGVQGVVTRIHVADNGEAGYDVQIEPGLRIFCAGTRLKAVQNEKTST